MRMATRLGFALLLPGTFYFLYILTRYVVMDDFVRGWGPLIGSSTRCTSPFDVRLFAVRTRRADVNKCAPALSGSGS
jgi:hypothetical protein